MPEYPQEVIQAAKRLIEMQKQRPEVRDMVFQKNSLFQDQLERAEKFAMRITK